MKIEDALRARLADLKARALPLRNGDENGHAITEGQVSECSAWLAAAQNAVHLICPLPNTAYRSRVDNVCQTEHGWAIHRAVGEVAAILRALELDADAGLIASVANQASAEVFDDFLEHAVSYLSQKKKNEAGVISGVVFEDTLRRICRMHSIVEKDVQLNTLISALSSKGELTPIKAKRARAAAHVRTKATHAQWDEFELADVKAAIEFTRELVEAKLGS